MVVNWVRDYFQKYDKAPEEDITNLFLTEGEKLVITSEKGDAVIDIDLDSLKEAWQKPFNWQ